MKALIVDDSIVEVETIQKILLQAGVKSQTSTRGLDVVRQAISYKPDIILLDLNMPDISGIEVCTRLMDNMSTKHIPILIISANSDQETKVEALKAGGVDYITKPFVAKDVLVRVRRYGALGEIINLCRTIGVTSLKV